MPNLCRAAALFLSLLAPNFSPAAAPPCPPAPIQTLHLPALTAALAAHRPIIIAALGSSSTAGAMASDPADSYPAELQSDLARAFPTAEISVINRGINGEDARRENQRMASDILALHPQLIIWQVGANAAARGEPAPVFTQLVRIGLRRLHATGADIILMDNQRSDRLRRQPDNARINQALSHLAREYRVNLFSRDRLMRHWPHLHRYLAPDHMHLNDRGYACTAEALASAIRATRPAN
jgi:lysophospholipase L1-like esterase